MNDERLREAFERGLYREGDRAPLDDMAAERLRRLVEREGPEDERLRTLDMQLSSAEGRRDLDIVWAAARAARPRSQVRRWLAAASVLAAVGISGIWFAKQPSTPVLRSEASPITLLAPTSSNANAANRLFVWHAYPNTERYLLVVVDSLGREVFTTETRDTTVVIPDSMQIAASREYLWWVQATTRSGAVVKAGTQRFRMGAI